MAGFWEWSSIYRLDADGPGHEKVHYYVAKFPDRIRKGAALMKDDGHTISAVAYFREEKEAIAFAEAVLGGWSRSI